MQNPGPSQIFYKVDETRLIQTKYDRMTWITWMIQPGYNPDNDPLGLNQHGSYMA